MEEEVAVRHPLALVVDHPLAAFALVVGGKILLDWKRRDEDEVTQRPSGNHTETTVCRTQTHRVISGSLELQVFENVSSLTENTDLKYRSPRLCTSQVLLTCILLHILTLIHTVWLLCINV